MPRFILFTSFSAILLILLKCCTPKEEVIHLTFVQTSDVHGAIFPYDFTLDKPAKGSLAQVFKFVEDLVGAGHEHLILLDNGDLIQGDPASYYYNYIKTDTSHLFARAMAYMGYQAVTVGNHDIEGGHEVYDKVVAESTFPWLAANALRTRDSLPYFQAYTIVNRGGLKIAILGLVTPHIPRWLPDFLYDGMYFEDMVSSAIKWVDIIQKEEQPDILIGLFHSGVDTSGYENYKNAEHASAHVAKLVEGFDLIFAGHDHKGWNLRIPNIAGDTVILMAPTSGAKDLALAELEVRRTPKGAIQKTWKTHIISLEDQEPSSRFMEYFRTDFENIKNYVNDTVGFLSEDIPFTDALFGPSAAVDFIHRVQLEASDASISLAASMSYEGKLEKGPIRVRDLFRLYRYENFLYRMQLSGKEIHDVLEYAAGKWFNQMYTPNDALLAYVKDESDAVIRRGKYPVTREPFYNFSSAAGLHYVIDVRKPPGDRVVISHCADGKPFDMGKLYMVAINSYRGNGGGGHLSLGAGIHPDSLPGRVVWCSDSEIRSLIATYLGKESAITGQGLNHWQIIPNEWWTISRDNEMQRWFME